MVIAPTFMHLETVKQQKVLIQVLEEFQVRVVVAEWVVLKQVNLEVQVEGLEVKVVLVVETETHHQ